MYCLMEKNNEGHLSVNTPKQATVHNDAHDPILKSITKTTIHTHSQNSQHLHQAIAMSSKNITPSHIYSLTHSQIAYYKPSTHKQAASQCRQILQRGCHNFVFQTHTRASNPMRAFQLTESMSSLQRLFFENNGGDLYTYNRHEYMSIILFCTRATISDYPIQVGRHADEHLSSRANTINLNHYHTYKTKSLRLSTYPTNLQEHIVDEDLTNGFSNHSLHTRCRVMHATWPTLVHNLLHNIATRTVHHIVVPVDITDLLQKRKSNVDHDWHMPRLP